MKYLSCIPTCLILASCATSSGNPAATLNNEGNSAYFRGNADEALVKYEAARKAAKDANDRQYEAIAMYGLARANMELCKPQEAEQWFVESIKIRDSLPDDKYAYVTQNLLEYSRLLIATGRAKDAVAPMERAVAKLDADGTIESSDPIAFADVLDDYAGALTAAGQSQKAEAARSRAKSLRQANTGRRALFKPTPYPARCKVAPTYP